MVARAIEWRVLSRVARAWSSSWRAIARRAAASSIWLCEAMPSGSAFRRASWVSSRSALAVSREICASFSRSCSSSARASTRASGAPLAILAPGSATQSRRPATSAARRASLRLTTVPVAAAVAATLPWTTGATVTGAGGGAWSCARAALADREETASAAHATRHAVERILRFIMCLPRARALPARQTILPPARRGAGAPAGARA